MPPYLESACQKKPHTSEKPTFCAIIKFFNCFNEIATECLEGCQSDENFSPEQTGVEELNVFIETTKVTPLKIPAKVITHCQASYAKCKEAEIESAVFREISADLTAAYVSTEQPDDDDMLCLVAQELWLAKERQDYS